ncbi:MAG: 30S ribosomal protein S3ae [Candidatus Aenigmarchaeota archaeon]|nr:30S ribosomal protein S3ae [Candidatus Aenigmarchaeota archaeon]
MAKRPIKVKEKWKGKEWYQILAPKTFNNMVIGETPSLDPKIIAGRVVETSLMELTGDTQKYYMKLYFKISDLDGSKAMTKYFGHTCTRDYIARIVQIRTTRVDTNNILLMKDAKMRLKSIIICNRNVSNLVKKAVRKAAVDMIKEKISPMTTDEFIKAMIAGKLQIEIRKALNKVYPIRFFEIRKTEVIKN